MSDAGLIFLTALVGSVALGWSFLDPVTREEIADSLRRLVDIGTWSLEEKE